LSFRADLTVRLAPPDSVWLLSDLNESLVQGAIPYALASAIAAGESREALVTRLSARFPAVEVDSALSGLVTNAYVEIGPVTAPMAPDVSGSSLAAPPATLPGRPAIGVVSVGGFDCGPLVDALAELAVDATMGVAEMSVVVADDYLDPSLEDFDRERRAVGGAWMLCQPAGRFPLVGPRFAGSDGPCWSCMAVRLKGNRPVRAFLDRVGAPVVRASPLSALPPTPAVLGVVATHLAQRLAPTEPAAAATILRLDPAAMRSSTHPVTKRPQCPQCGRAPTPFDFAGLDGGVERAGRRVRTSGGYKACSPARTLSRLAPNVDPLTGVVSRLDAIVVRPWNRVYQARFAFDPAPASLEELVASLETLSYGKGSTDAQAKASAIGEAIERHSGVFQGYESRQRRRFADFRPGEAMHPNAIMLFSEAQLRKGPTAALLPWDSTPARFDDEAPTDWSPAWSLTRRRPVLLPTGCAFYFYEGPGSDQLLATSNGCAAGNTYSEAIVQAFLELVERDAYAIWWYNRLRCPAIDPGSLRDPYLRRAAGRHARLGRRLWLFDITSDLGIPVVAAISVRSDLQDDICIGAGAHFDPEIAAQRAVSEVGQFLPFRQVAAARELRLADHPWLLPQGEAPLRGDAASDGAPPGELATALSVARWHGLEVIALDQTRPDVGLPVVRVVVPGLRHFWPRLAPGRLYDVPVAMGHRDQPMPEGALTATPPPL
jgi:oxazoline/thiazoline synthase